MGALFLERLKSGAPWFFDPHHLKVLHRGHVGCAAALELARQWIDGGLDRVVVLAIDSYLDPFTLEWLEQRRRLKTSERPVGLMPGEAGAAVLVESRSSAVRRGTRVQAWIRAVTTGQEPRHLFQDKPNSGEALATVTAACLDAAASNTPFRGDVVVDLNGEEWRAREWGNARVRIAPRLDGALKWVLPAASIGDVGAASGAVGLCVAIRSLVRRYATGRRVLVVSSSEWGDVGAILVAGEE
ncbi:hypothetical protein [Archangium lansingense]|uniref:Beta-ketoacyl synthase N-terminal domain-containing protein n=1 Tax=Archangium lansingense TaxID=2995310 RepID=A0ABT4AG68_9BACT|nr:hypothetical protein [Archangium lansinium]MCY1080164.1 hypothetical protein [Archangium lansinium]